MDQALGYCPFGTARRVGEIVRGKVLLLRLTREGVDRIPGHPASIDAVVALTSDVIASGSEDGMVRVMQILPNKFREWLYVSMDDLLNTISRSHCNARGLPDRAYQAGPK